MEDGVYNSLGCKLALSFMIGEQEEKYEFSVLDNDTVIVDTQAPEISWGEWSRIPEGNAEHSYFETEVKIEDANITKENKSMNWYVGRDEASQEDIIFITDEASREAVPFQMKYDEVKGTYKVQLDCDTTQYGNHVLEGRKVKFIKMAYHNAQGQEREKVVPFSDGGVSAVTTNCHGRMGYTYSFQNEIEAYGTYHTGLVTRKKLLLLP